MSKYKVGDIVVTVYYDVARIMDVYPDKTYKVMKIDSLHNDIWYPCGLRDDEIKTFLGTARYPLSVIFDVYVEGVDDPKEREKLWHNKERL